MHAKRVLVLLVAAGFLMAGTSASARPMWEIAPVWFCKIKYHFKMGMNGENLRVNEETNVVIYDFANSSAASAFGNSTGRITNKYYVEGDGRNFNYIEEKWSEFGTYPWIIEETNGEFWGSQISGITDEDGRLWIAIYRCLPSG